MIRYIKGDATDPIVKDGLRIILHICNDQGGWSEGFVLSLSSRWKEPESIYKAAKQYNLGTIQTTLVDQSDSPIIVCNMIAQHNYKTKDNPIPLRMEALYTCLYKLNDYCMKRLKTSDITLHAPRFGCGLAGGRWIDIEKLLNELFKGIDIYIYDL